MYERVIDVFPISFESKNRLREAFAGNAAHQLYLNQPAVSSNKKSYFM